MPLKDLRHSAQWSELPGSGAALPPPAVPAAFLTGAAVLPMIVAAGALATGPTLSGSATLPMIVASGTAVVENGPELTGAVTLPMIVAAGVMGETIAFVLSPSVHIGASGEATTAQLTPPAGKTTADFQAGRIQDDENPADSLDLGADKYTELEWCAVPTADSEDVDYEFRVAIE